uniref:ShKT domain-containing protein n=1 Tax=Steinernema glaseri TaxID=37863 RepID=A0A1I8AC41_9BILA
MRIPSVVCCSIVAVMLIMTAVWLYISFLLTVQAETSVYTVFTLSPTSEDQIDFLRNERLKNGMLDFWREPTRIGAPIHVMIKDAHISDFRNELNVRNITHEILIKNVEKLIKKLKDKAATEGANVYSHATKDVINFDFGRFHPYEDVVAYAQALATHFPDRVQIASIGKTHEGRDIPVLKIGTKGNQKKPAIWIDGGIHAREWISPAVVLFFVDQLVGAYSTDPFIKKLVDSLDWYIVPLLNPDGYEFSRSSTDPVVRFWRKNRSPALCKPDTMECCEGVDLNRNFDWFFGAQGSSTDPCQDIYNGAEPFSEPETAAVRDFLLNVSDDLKSFLTFHSYAQVLMFPYGHLSGTYPGDVTELQSTAIRAANALKSVYGTNYVVGTGADILYPASGGSDDWVKGKLGIKYTYLFELRPQTSDASGFLFDSSQIIPTALETWEAVKVIVERVLDQYGSGTESPAGNKGPDVIDALDKMVHSEKETLTNPKAQVEKTKEKIAAQKSALEMAAVQPPTIPLVGDTPTQPQLPDLGGTPLVPQNTDMNALFGQNMVGTVTKCLELLSVCSINQQGQDCRSLQIPCVNILRQYFT